ncbi:amino acid or sugar ABC transport system, permease protein [delta proteobacterium NaphS2]|nr:amino acid or sugar ABC transport system, permease protein [delta proteobacterium NaphS2]
MEFLLQLSLDGVSLGLLYGISAIGFILIYRSSGLLNFAHGGMIGFGAFLFFALSAWANWPVIIAFAVTLVCSFGLGLILEKWIIRPVFGRENLIHYILITLGLALMLKSVLSFVFEKSYHHLPVFVPHAFSRGWFGFQFTSFHIIALTAGIGVLLLYRFYFAFSPQGISMRAFAENRLTARTLGIPVKRILAMSWAISALLCALTGILLGMMNGPAADSLSAAGLKIFPVIVLGGINSIGGAVIGGIIIGLLETFVGPYASPQLQNLLPYMALVLIIVIKPTGFSGDRDFKKR